MKHEAEVKFLNKLTRLAEEIFGLQKGWEKECAGSVKKWAIARKVRNSCIVIFGWRYPLGDYLVAKKFGISKAHVGATFLGGVTDDIEPYFKILKEKSKWL